MNKYDDHYKNAEIEPIDVMEMVVQRTNTPILVLYNVSMAVKYLLRIGLKNDWVPELDKAINYLHRAKTGDWIK